MDNTTGAEAHHQHEAVCPPEWEIWPLPEMYESRVLLDDISCKWVILTIATLSRGSARFNQLRRTLRGVTQKTLTQVLRRLERSGLISRTLLDTAPISVEYAITPLGRTLAGPLSAIYRWTQAHHREVEAARRGFDARTANVQIDMQHSAQMPVGRQNVTCGNQCATSYHGIQMETW